MEQRQNIFLQSANRRKPPARLPALPAAAASPSRGIANFPAVPEGRTAPAPLVRPFAVFDGDVVFNLINFRINFRARGVAAGLRNTLRAPYFTVNYGDVTEPLLRRTDNLQAILTGPAL